MGIFGFDFECGNSVQVGMSEQNLLCSEEVHHRHSEDLRIYRSTEGLDSIGQAL